MTDARRAPHPECIARILPPGAAVILRDYDDPRRAGLAARLRVICAARGVLLLVGADASLARRIGADGVHLPEWAPAQDIPGGMIVTASAHDRAGLAAAAAKGAQAVLLSPAFATQSHPGAPALGAARFTALAAASPLPVIALGGVDETNARRLVGPNVAGFAAIGAFAR